MKQHPTFALICVLSLFVNLQVFSHDFEVDGIFYNYNLDDGTAIVTSEYEDVYSTRSYTTCTVEKLLSTCHPIVNSMLCHPSVQFSVDYSNGNNSKRPTPIF